MINTNPLIAIAGPTACGKTATAVALAQRVNGEIISADSMLVYRGMDIGTAKPTLDEREGIPHHLIDVVDPDESFSAARYQALACSAIERVRQRGKTPILAGGTGFYINSVVYGNEFTPIGDGEAEAAFRRAWEEKAASYGNTYVHEQLRRVDSESAEKIHPNNLKRVIRALAYHHFTGASIALHNRQERQRSPKERVCYVLLRMERAALYQRINQRVLDMFERGLEAEVEGLLAAGYGMGLTAMQGLGYKETVRYLMGECTQAEAVEAIQTGTRHYAKRQITWFTHQTDGVWFEADGKTAAVIADDIMRMISRSNL